MEIINYLKKNKVIVVILLVASLYFFTNGFNNILFLSPAHDYVYYTLKYATYNKIVSERYNSYEMPFSWAGEDFGFYDTALEAKGVSFDKISNEIKQGLWSMKVVTYIIPDRDIRYKRILTNKDKFISIGPLGHAAFVEEAEINCTPKVQEGRYKAIYCRISKKMALDACKKLAKKVLDGESVKVLKGSKTYTVNAENICEYFFPDNMAFSKAYIVLEKVKPQQPSTCGNGICEPNYGENEKTCPKDCAVQQPPSQPPEQPQPPENHKNIIIQIIIEILILSVLLYFVFKILRK